ncbi:26S protease regulatory subunit 8 [Hibiscus syriacus]|uniref:26S protease regulatory subunit 8 n=1 Tax=Hibiscus syriacus TaxID=106335 RepID=A0A6A2YUB5_HIBSY|nr:26S protease regulatory subunit 8 [Hibiscus syriacus]
MGSDVDGNFESSGYFGEARQQVERRWRWFVAAMWSCCSCWKCNVELLEWREGKYVVDIDKNIDITKFPPSTRVALRNDSYVLHLILPSKVIELPIKHPELFESLGIAQPKGVLLYGPPGTGKTLLARAVAHHTDCTFIRVSGSELVQNILEGSRMVREVFVMASGNGDSEVQRTIMLELLNQLDGFEAPNKIKVLMATNRIDILDQALLRPGRIDRKIEFPNPNEDSRLDILKTHSRRMNFMRGIDLKKIAEKMNGASGAELKRERERERAIFQWFIEVFINGCCENSDESKKGVGDEREKMESGQDWEIEKGTSLILGSKNNNADQFLVKLPCHKNFTGRFIALNDVKNLFDHLLQWQTSHLLVRLF